MYRYRNEFDNAGVTNQKLMNSSIHRFWIFSSLIHAVRESWWKAICHAQLTHQSIFWFAGQIENRFYASCVSVNLLFFSTHFTLAHYSFLLMCDFSYVSLIWLNANIGVGKEWKRNREKKRYDLHYVLYSSTLLCFTNLCSIHLSLHLHRLF